MAPLQTISFDLWDTVFINNSDEPRRKELGLPTKNEERRELVWRFLQKYGPISRKLIDLTYDTIDKSFREAWEKKQITGSVSKRLEQVLSGLQRGLPEDDFSELVRLHETMELRTRPKIVPGAAKALKTLHQKYKLVIISDTIFTPGWGLRRLLRAHRLLDLFIGFVFSDEIGHSKPHQKVFQKAAQLADCKLSKLVHVGDRERNDIEGAKNVGAKAILFTACLESHDPNTKADAICDSFSKLPTIIESLDQP
ncbi:MAG: HAD family hydrolase [Pseudomonadota bacterium]